jgi:hypothetical protein
MPCNAKSPHPKSYKTGLRDKGHYHVVECQLSAREKGMPYIEMTAALATDIGLDAGNASMRRNSRTVWDEGDWNAATIAKLRYLAAIPQYNSPDRAEAP